MSWSALSWQLKSSNEVHRQYQTLKMRDGPVFDMHDYRQPQAAHRALR